MRNVSQSQTPAKLVMSGVVGAGGPLGLGPLGTQVQAPPWHGGITVL